MKKIILLLLVSASSLLAQSYLVDNKIEISYVTNRTGFQMYPDRVVYEFVAMESHVTSSYKFNGEIYPSTTNFFHPMDFKITNSVPLPEKISSTVTNAPVPKSSRYRQQQPPNPL